MIGAPMELWTQIARTQFCSWLVCVCVCVRVCVYVYMTHMFLQSVIAFVNQLPAFRY